MPHRLSIKDNWQAIKPVLKHLFPLLTDEDLIYEEGKEDELYERIGHRTHTSPENVRTIVERMDLAL